MSRGQPATGREYVAAGSHPKMKSHYLGRHTSYLTARHSIAQHPTMARHGIALKIAPLKPPTRLATGLAIAHAPNPPTLKCSAPMQHPTIIEHNRVAFAQLMRIHCTGGLCQRGEARKRVVEIVRRVEWERRLERRAVTHRGNSRL